VASGDYRSCDVCGCKVFYDANLDYDNFSDFAKSGGALFNNERSYLELHTLGAWTVLCKSCTLTHVIKLEKIKGEVK
jgi:hypothetical protein